MGMGLAGLKGAEGAKNSIAEILAQRLLEARQVEDQKQNQSENDFRNKSLDLNTKLREDALREKQQSADETRAMKGVTMRPHGSEVTPAEQGAETAAGVPSSLYTPHDANLKSVSMTGFQSLPGAKPAGDTQTQAIPARDKGATWGGYAPQEIQLAQLSSLSADRAADNTRADAAAKETARYHTGMINKPTGAPDARLDKSYQFNSAQLETAAKPLADRATRLQNLRDTINQKTPQADALIAPELLTVMAGGPGSGMRMNEAEIARIVGGRSNAESLKAALNKWQLDPSKALSITDAQRADVAKLLDVVNGRLHEKVKNIGTARSALVNAGSVDEHRKIVSDAMNQLNADSADTAGSATGLPDLSGLKAGVGRTFNSGPFAGQTWTVGADGQPKQVGR